MKTLAASLLLLFLLTTTRGATADEEPRRRSTPLVVLGIVGVVLSVPTIVGGSMALGFCANGQNEGSFTPQRGQCDLLPSTAITAFGVGLLAGGIAGIVYGSATVEPHDALAFVPRVAIGPRAASLTWRF